MSIPHHFQFRYKANKTIYSADKTSEYEYTISWGVDSESGVAGSRKYTIDNVYDHLTNGHWNIVHASNRQALALLKKGDF